MRLRPVFAAAVLAGLALVSAGAAQADVKAGVDAWAAGDFARAVGEWKAPAAKGDADAMFNLAQAFRLGRGMREDVRQAEILYARAAALGHLPAADNYGLLLFQDGRREQAMPYVSSAADRGDPRAQYLLGIAYFNGDLMPRDYVRAYALLTLANGAGLPQAASGIRQMDEFVPIAQRQQAQALAGQMRAEADSRRASAMAAADLGFGLASVAARPLQAATPVPAAQPVARIPQTVASVAMLPSTVGGAESAAAEAMHVAGTDSPAGAGADFVRSNTAVAANPGGERIEGRRVPTDPPPPSRPVPTAGGPWKLQLGAFSLAGGAERLWAKLASEPALAGKTMLTAQAGKLTRLLASGWPSQAAAQSVCNALKTGGQECIVTR